MWHKIHHFNLQNSYLFLFTIVFFMCNVFQSSSEALSDVELTSSQWLKKLAENFGNELNGKIFLNSTGADHLKQLYGSYEIQTLNTEAILNDVVSQLSKLLSSAEEKVKILAAKAEELNKGCRRKPELTSAKVKFYDQGANISANLKELFEIENSTMYYYNAKCGSGYQLPDKPEFGDNKHACSEPPGGLSEKESFSGLNVSFNSSAVHIPVDVYNEDSKILRDIAWSQEMDPLFREQIGKTGWLYIATRNGMLRYFPSSPWRMPEDQPDFFDSRSKSWFVQSMSSPKDVVIMIDGSGSVTGLTLNLIKMSVRHIMSSLSENDFFNIIVFSTKADFLDPSCPDLMQATPLNKEISISWLDEIKPMNASSYEKGFQLVFDTLKSGNFTRSSCNPSVLLLSDGGAEYPHKIFDERNKPETTRIFSYSVGKHFSSTASLQEMACNNRGKFFTIPSDSATHFQTMKYLDKLSKPLANTKEKFNKWTLPYEDQLGLGTVMTVSRPIYEAYEDYTDLTSDEDHVVKVIGVAAADVIHDGIKVLMDVSKYGYNAYMFGIENNGFLFYHPLLKRDQFGAPATNDIHNIEHMKVNELRRLMIDRQSGSSWLNRLILSADKLHLDDHPFHYTFSPMADFLFSVGLALPANKLSKLSYNATTSYVNIIYDHVDVFSEAYGIVCDNNSASETPLNFDASTIPQDSSTSLGNSLRDVAAMIQNCSSDHRAQLNELFMHGLVTRKLVADSWFSAKPKMVEAVFVVTDSKPSILRVKYEGVQENRKGIEESLRDPSTKDYFLRALLSNSTVYSVMKVDKVPEATTAAAVTRFTTDSSVTTDSDVTTASWQTTVTSNPGTITLIVASQAVTLDTTPSITPAVTGVVLNYDELRLLLLNMSLEQCTLSGNCTKHYNCQNEDRMCLILDDGGLLVVTNQEDHQHMVGKFFGSLDGDLMQSLEDYGLYEPRLVEDYQEVCKKVKRKGNSAPRNLFFPTITDVLNIGWWFSAHSWIMMQNILYFFSNFFHSALARKRDHTGTMASHQSEGIDINPDLRRCVIQRKVFHFGTQMDSVEGIADCYGCNRSYFAKRITNTNLLFVVADSETQCSLDNGNGYRPYPDLEKEITNEIECPSRRHRRPPNKECYDVRKIHVSLDKDCNDSGGVELNSPHVSLFIALTTIITYILGNVVIK